MAFLQSANDFLRADESNSIVLLMRAGRICALRGEGSQIVSTQEAGVGQGIVSALQMVEGELADLFAAPTVRVNPIPERHPADPDTAPTTSRSVAPPTSVPPPPRSLTQTLSHCDAADSATLRAAALLRGRHV
jgi:hypothetical protein